MPSLDTLHISRPGSTKLSWFNLRKHGWRDRGIIVPFSQQLKHQEVMQKVRFKFLRGFKPTCLTSSSYQAIQLSGRDLAPSISLNFSALYDKFPRVKQEGLGGWETWCTFLGRMALEVQPSLRSLLTGKYSCRMRIRTSCPCTMAHSYAMRVAHTLVFLLDTTPVILSDRILCFGKDDVNGPSITIGINMNFISLHF